MTDRYRMTRFLSSANELSQLPTDTGREIALAGRSNAGKSSALNTLTGQSRLARVSKTPGRTQLINLFTVDESHCLVDLPGYGYAQVPEAIKRHWQNVLARYLETRQALVGLLLMMDIRHPFNPLDRQMLEWTRHRGLDTHVLLTKCDKLSRGPALATLAAVRRELATAFPNASAQLFSSLDRTGLAEAQARLDAWFGFSATPPHA